MLRTDGGMVENDLLMLGAAYAAGLATGFYSDIKDLRANWAVDHTWNPRMDETTRESLFESWEKSVTRSFN